MVVVEFPVGDRHERVTVMNVHLRSRAEAEAIRRRQAKLVGVVITGGQDPFQDGPEFVLVAGELKYRLAARSVGADIEHELTGRIHVPDDQVGINEDDCSRQAVEHLAAMFIDAVGGDRRRVSGRRQRPIVFCCT
jgi:hypothetical protein